MTDQLTSVDLARKLNAIKTGLTATVESLSNAQFERRTDGEWPASDYLKHLILSVKPIAKGLSRPPEVLAEAFGRPERPSMGYDALVALYTQRIAEGIRAEMVPAVTPVEYRLPPDAVDVKSTLITAWNAGNDRLIAALDGYDDLSLDTYQIPHPAIGMLTLREMLYFTVHHNTLHWRDIKRVALGAPISE